MTPPSARTHLAAPQAERQCRPSRRRPCWQGGGLRAAGTELLSGVVMCVRLLRRRTRPAGRKSATTCLRAA